MQTFTLALPLLLTVVTMFRNTTSSSENRHKKGLPFLCAVLALCVLPSVSSRAQEPRKPAVLFLSRPLAAHYGGAYLRQNIARLDRMGYRVAYYAFTDLNNQKPETIGSFDVVVFLDMPSIDYTGTKEITPATVTQYAEIRKLLKAGGGVFLFPEPGEFAMRALWPLVEPYGFRPLVGCFADPAPSLGVFDSIYFAHTTNVAKHPLTQGVRGTWYPVAGVSGTRFDFDALRNANTMPFDVDRNWTVLAAARDSTQFTEYESNDNRWLQQPQFQKLATTPAPLIAVREGAEGAGRMAVCGINSAYTNFFAGNFAYDGVCTDKGLEGKPSDLDKLLMNILDWLAEPSMKANRPTLAASLKDTFSIEPFRFPPPLPVDGTRPLRPNPDQFQGLIGARTIYSGGNSTVAEYAKVARELGLDYLAFLEDFGSLKLEVFDQFKKECEENSDSKLLLIPGLRVDNSLGIHFFGFRIGLQLPQPSHLKPGTRLLTQQEGGQYQWSVKNGDRTGMACGNFRLEGKEPAGVPASDYNVLNPFISLYTYQSGKLSDTMLDTYLKCAARTEWVSPIAIHLMDSAEELRREWKSDHFKTVWLRDPGKGLESLKTDLGDRYAFAPVSYVTNGPRIEEWRSNDFDGTGDFWDWTRYRWFVRMAVSSQAGLKEIRVMDGSRLLRRFLPKGARRFEQMLVLTHNDMHNLILIVTDNDGHQAISDEEWDKNQLLQLTWCSDRNNMLSYAGLPAPKSPSGSTACSYPTPWNLEKGGFRENLVPAINMDRSLLPGFDGQPYYPAHVSPAPSISTGMASEGDNRIARDIGREMSSPDVAIQTAHCRLVYDKSVEKVHPWTRGPLTPMQMFQADLRYITFSHAGHLPAPVILEGKIRILKDLTFALNVPLGIQVLTMNAWQPGGQYRGFAIQHSRTGNHAGLISYDTGVPTPQYVGDFNRGAYIYFYPSPFGAVGLISLDDNLKYRYSNHYVAVGYNTAGKTLKACTELQYRVLILVGSFDDIASTDTIEIFRSQLGLAEKGKVGYSVKVEQGKITRQEYALTLDAERKGFVSEIALPADFPVSLPIIVENLNDKWTSVIYDRDKKRMRPLGMRDNKAYCHRAPEERGGRIFIGHPFTASHKDLWLSVVQTGEKELTLQIHNPTDKPVKATITRNPAFDMIAAPDFAVTVPAGQTVERVVR